MIPVSSMKDKIVALFGLGSSGIVTAKALVAGGAELVAWDDNPEILERAHTAGIQTGDLRRVDWKVFSALVLSPGVPLTHPYSHWSVDLARASGVEIIGDIELFVRERILVADHCPLIAITGTNGKSTTTALIAHILKVSGRDVQLGGNIGTAVMMLEPPVSGRHYVIECSSYQIDLAPSLNPSVGVLLNVTPDHLDRHGTMQHYAEIKERLVTGSATAIIAIDDHYCAQIADRLELTGKKTLRISKYQRLEEGYFYEREKLVYATGGVRKDIASLKGIGSLRGEHNAQNALAAMAACLSCGVQIEEIQAGLNSFPGLAHRMEQIGRRGTVLFINDSKATNADAAAPALSSFKRIYWIAGGLPKEGGITSLRGFFPRIVKAYLIGEAAPQFATILDKVVPYEISGTIATAVEHAANDAEKDREIAPVVLLSPACASYDQFQNFEKRGEAFRQTVLALTGIQPIEEMT